MPVAAGKLRHRVTLQEQQTTTSPYGETVTEWVDVGNVWADVAPQSGREFMASQSLQSEVTTRITIRYRDDINALWRIAYRGRTYDIHAALPDNGSGLAHLSLMCREVSP